jgi:hypothetical protein
MADSTKCSRTAPSAGSFLAIAEKALIRSSSTGVSNTAAISSIARSAKVRSLPSIANCRASVKSTYCAARSSEVSPAWLSSLLASSDFSAGLFAVLNSSAKSSWIWFAAALRVASAGTANFAGGLSSARAVTNTTKQQTSDSRPHLAMK